ncbi:MAG: ROK family protein [Oscillospiraceae bacterium]|nr:ROK family protein [Oscillospiraceae bacterium]
MKTYIGIDLGGTNIVCGVVEENYNIVGSASVKTNLPRPAEAIMDDMVKAAELAAENAGIKLSDAEWVGVGSPGTINSDTGIVEYSNNIQFYDVHMRDYLKARLGRDIYLDNDANAAAYGEVLAGGAKGAKNAVVITLGTGLGSGIIVEGKMVRGANFGGGEFGHTVIVYGGRECTCGRKGCLEAYASATGLINITKETMKQNHSSLMWALCEGDLNNASGRTAFSAAKEGDAAGQKVVDEYLGYLACGISNAVNIFQPEVVCIGGGISNEGENLLAPLRELAAGEDYTKNSEKRTKLVRATLGGNAGIIGAAFLGNL